MKRFCVLFLGLTVVVSLAQSIRPALSTPNSARLVANYGKLPLAFEANQGQMNQQVRFLSRGAGYSLFLTSTEAVLALQPSAPGDQPSGKPGFRSYASGVRNPKPPASVLRMKLLNANPQAEISGQDEFSGKSNYFIGNDPKKWRTNVPQFAKVRYKNVYRGVDLVYYGHQRELEYDFVLQPGAKPEAIKFGMEGAEKLRFDHGDLVLTSSAGEVRLRSPRIYQQVNGIKQEVRGHYVINGKDEVAFAVADYDRRRALVIDPVLAYSTYLGGSAQDSAFGIAVDSTGNAYVTGYSDSTDFPLVNAIQPKLNGATDVFVTKINADGTGLVYSTFLGGSSYDSGNGIAVDSAGNAYVVGYSDSTDFPTTNAIQPTFGGLEDAFLTKINAEGSALVYSTYLGGSDIDWGVAVATDSAGNAYVTGNTASKDFPTANAIQPTHGAEKYWNPFVTKINSAGSAFVYSTYLSGSSSDSANGIAADTAGNTYVTGFANSTDFPTTADAFQRTQHGGSDAFVTKFNANGSAFVYSTYLGGSAADSGWGIAVDSAGNAYVTGVTNSTDFPTANPIQPAFGGVFDAFVTKVNASGSALVYSTYLGGSDNDADSWGGCIAVDNAGNAYVTGNTLSTNFPTVNALQSKKGGLEDAFVTRINSEGSALNYSTYLGGASHDFGYAIAVDSAGSAYVAGITGSKNFPTTQLAFQRSKHGVFVSKIASQTSVEISPRKLIFPIQVLGTPSAAKKLTFTNLGSSTLAINNISISGLNPADFAETNTCGSSLAPNASCTISVTFTPTKINARSAVLGISDSDPTSPQVIALSGTGTFVSLSPKSLAFGKVPVGTSSAPQKVKLTNVGSTQLNFTGITITGTNVGDFSQTNTCGSSIAGGASCTITVTFTPSAVGTRKAAVSISDDGGGSPQKVTLTGTGT